MIQNKKIMVTGGLGFIGSHFIDLALKCGYSVINIDKMTYATRKDLDFNSRENYEFVKKDICKLKKLPSGISHIVNFAAESHVDNSIKSNEAFIRSNTEGVYNLLELIRREPAETRPVLIQISTDEVYGDIESGSFDEKAILSPSSPYSASKAAADMLIKAWIRTYGIKARTCRPSNNYGYGQNAEKLIPRAMKLGQKGLKTPVHGDGSYKREWLFVGDCCEAIKLVMEKGEDGEIYNISANEELSNIEVVKMVLEMLGKDENLFEFVPNRPGQDIRYSVNSDKIKSLGWKPKMSLKEYLPICEKLNEERRRKQKPGKKERILKFLKLK